GTESGRGIDVRVHLLLERVHLRADVHDARSYPDAAGRASQFHRRVPNSLGSADFGWSDRDAADDPVLPARAAKAHRRPDGGRGEGMTRAISKTKSSHWRRSMTSNPDLAKLHDLATQIRRDAVRMIAANASGHVGGALGAAEILAALYGHVMRHGPRDPNRDRFVLSNGHVCAAFYAALSRAGYIDPQE